MSIVTLDEMKVHLLIDDPGDEAAQAETDMKLASFIAQAEAAAEDFCKSKFTSDCGCERVPEPVRLAVMLFVSHLYEYRDNHDKQAYIAMRMAFESLLWPHRDVANLF